MSFGKVAIGSVSPPRFVELRSRFDYTVMITGVRTDGLRSDGRSFRVAEDGCTGMMLTPATMGNCVLQVIFQPHTTGEIEGDIEVHVEHTCTSEEYFPCIDNEEVRENRKNFTRTELANGQVIIDWWAPLKGEEGVLIFVGEGVA